MISHPKAGEKSIGLQPARFSVIQRPGTTPVTVCRQPLPEHLEPRSVLAALEGESLLFLLESADGPLKTARYSVVGCNPPITFSARRSSCETVERGKKRVERGDPVQMLRKLLAPYRIPPQASLPAFFGGAVGLFSYDMKNYFEELPETVEDDLETPDCFVAFVDTVIVFDRAENTAEIIASAFHSENLAESRARARAKAEDLLGKLTTGLARAPGKARIRFGKMSSTHTREQYAKMVERTKEYIAAGDIFQANLSQRLCFPFEGSPIELYKRLSAINPSPFASYFDFGDFQLVSCSPERLVRTAGDVVETRPIAGTHPRGRDKAEDEEMRRKLVKHPKERAEHIMIVDMARNDIGRVSACGTVTPDELMVIEQYSHVFHIVSNVVGALLPGRDAFDVLAAVFPGASITGVPKIRCMEIIDELEPVRRGPYTGSLGWISYAGDMDLNIIIRTFVVKDGHAYIQVGGGVVADSVAEREYRETLNKAQALIEALGTGEKM